MRIEQLKYFLEVARSGSINATAQHLFISQQGISDALKRMEQELGVTLLNRSKTGITLTPEGEKIYPYIIPVVKEYEKMEDYIFSLKVTPKPKNEQAIRILTNPLSMTVMIPDLLELLERKYPTSNFYCSDTVSLDKMVQQIQDANADLCIFMLMHLDAETMLQVFPDDVQVYALFEDELVACVSSDSETAQHKSISAAEFDQLEKVLCDGAYTSPRYSDTEFVSNNIDFQLKLILKRKIAAVTIRYFFPRTFPNDAVTAVPIKPALKVRYYVMVPKVKLNEEIINVLNVLAEYILDLTGQTVAYSTNV